MDDDDGNNYILILAVIIADIVGFLIGWSLFGRRGAYSIILLYRRYFFF